MWLLWWRSQSDGDWTDQWTFGQCNLNFWEQNWRYWSNWKRLINGIIFLGEFPRFFKIFLYKYNDTCRNTGRGEQIRWRCSQRWLSDCVCLWNIPGYPFIYFFFFQGVRKLFTISWKYFLIENLGNGDSMDDSEGSLIGSLHTGVLYSFFLLSVYLDFIFFSLKESR